MKGTKFEEQVQNFNENMRIYETKRFFSFAKQLETHFITYFAKRSKLGETVSYFAKLKKNTKLSTLDIREGCAQVDILRTSGRNTRR